MFEQLQGLYWGMSEGELNLAVRKQNVVRGISSGDQSFLQWHIPLQIGSHRFELQFRMSDERLKEIQAAYQASNETVPPLDAVADVRDEIEKRLGPPHSVFAPPTSEPNDWIWEFQNAKITLACHFIRNAISLVILRIEPFGAGLQLQLPASSREIALTAETRLLPKN